MRKILLIAILMFGVVAAATAQDEVDVPLPDIPPGQQIVVTYRVTISEELQPNVTVISNQGVVTGSNFGPVYTNDPATVSENDATLTQLGFNLGVNVLPNTGEAPWWRLPLMIGGAVGAMVMLLLGIRSLLPQKQ